MITINLLPVREERRKAWARQYLVMVLAAVGATVGLAAVHYWWYSAEVSSAQHSAEEIQRQIDGYAPQLAQVEKFRAVKADIEKKLSIIDELSASRSGPVHLFDEIATHLPDRMWLTKMGVEGQMLTIEGVSLDNELVALFLTAMNASPVFEDVELLQTAAKEVDGYKLNAFEVSAVLSGSKQDDEDAGAAGGQPNAPKPAANPQQASASAALAGAGR
jgi:type IV pilus assembly protein PilN